MAVAKTSLRVLVPSPRRSVDAVALSSTSAYAAAYYAGEIGARSVARGGAKADGGSFIADAIAKGDLTHTIEARGHDETATLATA